MYSNMYSEFKIKVGTVYKFVFIGIENIIASRLSYKSHHKMYKIIKML